MTRVVITPPTTKCHHDVHTDKFTSSRSVYFLEAHARWTHPWASGPL